LEIILDLKTGGLRGSIESLVAMILITTQTPPALLRESMSEWSGVHDENPTTTA
jgi:hypothetical protein